MPLRGPGQGGAQFDLQRLGRHVHAEATPQPVEEHIGVCLAHAPQDHLMGLRVALDADRRVLRLQPTQGGGQLVLVLTTVGRDGQRQQRVRHQPRFHQQWRGRIAESVAGLGAAQARDGHDVAGDAC